MEEPEILHDVFFVLLYGGVIMLDVVAANKPSTAHLRGISEGIGSFRLGE